MLDLPLLTRTQRARLLATGNDTAMPQGRRADAVEFDPGAAQLFVGARSAVPES